MDKIINDLNKLNINDINIYIIKIQSIVRRYINNINLSKLKDNFTIDKVIILLENHIRSYNVINNINLTLIKKIRNYNFPPEISENIAKYAIYKKYKIMPTWNTKSGDLDLVYAKLEIKAFSSTGPISFGPNEYWNYIYFIDARNYLEKKFKIYECKLSNNDMIWKNIKINKNDTFEMQCKQNRRPRIVFKMLFEQLKIHMILIFDGHIDNL